MCSEWNRDIDTGPYFLATHSLGFALYVPAAIFVFGSMIELYCKGKAKDSDVLSPYETTVVVERGIFRVVRHPMWLGMGIRSVALILVSQSVLAIVLGIVTLNHFRMATVKETEFNIGRFDAPYREDIERVPKWNILGD